MLLPYLLLLCLYVLLTALYAFARPQPTPVRPWPLLPVPSHAAHLSQQPCQADNDCPSHHVCLQGVCVPKLLKAGKCDPATGRWITHSVRNTTFAVCSCLDPSLWTQNVFGGDCTVNVGCGVHGEYDPVAQRCQCDPRYVAVGLTCQKLPILEHLNLQPCGPDEINVAAGHPFRPEYAAVQPAVARCVKRPCSFDAFSGRPLNAKHARYDPDWGCVCDPSYGLFGVLLDGLNKKYLPTPGFDACASIFLQDPPEPVEVKLVTYFYLGNREPASLVLYEHPPDAQLIPLLKGKQGFMIRQALWRYDFAQHFFKHNKTFHARTRSATYLGIFGMMNVNEFDYVSDFEPTLCLELARMVLRTPVYRDVAYRTLYSSPVCSVIDETDDPQFHDRHILNPQQFVFTDYPELKRYNAFVLHYQQEMGRWLLDLDYRWEVDRFRAIPTNVPVFFPNP